MRQSRLLFFHLHNPHPRNVTLKIGTPIGRYSRHIKINFRIQKETDPAAGGKAPQRRMLRITPKQLLYNYCLAEIDIYQTSQPKVHEQWRLILFIYNGIRAPSHYSFLQVYSVDLRLLVYSLVSGDAAFTEQNYRNSPT